MGSNKSKIDPVSSPGYDPAKLSGSKLEHMQRCAHKAANAYPPAFVNQRQEWTSAIETPAGNEALRRGRQVSELFRTRHVNPRPPSLEEINSELGSADGFFTLFGLHYCAQFLDPRMSVLFDTRDPDTAASALDHGKRVACVVLKKAFGLPYYEQLDRGDHYINMIRNVHTKSKKCPMRPAEHPTAVFTVNQRDSWVGSVMCAAEEIGTSQAFQEKLGIHLFALTGLYGPYLDESNGNIDYM